MIEVFKFHPDAVTPTRAHTNDGGLDLYSLTDVVIPEGGTRVISTGLSIHVPPGSIGKIEDRSSLAQFGLRTGGGVIDAGYNGELMVIMHNINYNLHGGGYHIQKGQKIAQFLTYKVDITGVMVVNKLWESERADKGFGSSNKE